ncbi:MAG: hypothetical protein WBN92_12075 [Terriglobia bacterium]
MNTLVLGQLAIALVSVGTPWFVVRIAVEVAKRRARAVNGDFFVPLSVEVLGRATVAAALLITVPALWRTPPSILVGLLDVAGFVVLSVFGMRALGDINAANRSDREVSNATRLASLRPRRTSQYLSLPWRVLPFAATSLGAVLFVYRLGWLPSSNRRLLVPVAFVLFAPVFLWLFETWMRAEACGGRVAVVAGDESRIKHRVRGIYALESIVTFGFMGLSHALLNLDWSMHGAWGVAGALAGGILGVVGCALAVSSDLGTRRYRPADLESS